MTIKMTMADGTVIEGTAEELTELQRLSNGYEVNVEEGSSLEVGDYVVALPSADDEYLFTNTDMQLGKVLSEEDGYFSGEIRVKIVKHAEHPDEEGESFVVNPKHFRKATEEEIEAALTAGLKVGDYAKVVGNTYNEDIDVGTIVEVISGIDSDGDYKIELLDGSDYDYAKPESLEKVELDDVDLSFIRAGRIIGENKVGDIVEVIYGSGKIKEGDIGVVVSGDGDGCPKVRVGDNERYTYVKLIAPVESRVDADA